MKRPAHIDGHYRICCGARAEQCEDCPMKQFEIQVAVPPLQWHPNCNAWWNEEAQKHYRTWQEAHDA